MTIPAMPLMTFFNCKKPINKILKAKNAMCDGREYMHYNTPDKICTYTTDMPNKHISYWDSIIVLSHTLKYIELHYIKNRGVPTVKANMAILSIRRSTDVDVYPITIYKNAGVIKLRQLKRRTTE